MVGSSSIHKINIKSQFMPHVTKFERDFPLAQYTSAMTDIQEAGPRGVTVKAAFPLPLPQRSCSFGGVSPRTWLAKARCYGRARVSGEGVPASLGQSPISTWGFRLPPLLGGDLLSKGGRRLLLSGSPLPLLSVLFLVLRRSRVGGGGEAGGGAGGGSSHLMGGVLGRLRIAAAGEADAACPGVVTVLWKPQAPPSCSP